MDWKSIRMANVRGKRVIIRVDMNVPFDARGRILDDFRIRESLTTIRWILAHGGSVFVLLHRGRPEGLDKKLTIGPIARRVSQLLRLPVAIVSDPVMENPDQYRASRIIFCENIRFFPGEDKNSPALARALAHWGEIYVNDAFAVSHRKAASIVGLPRLLSAYAGLLLEKEIKTLDAVFVRPRRPFLAIFGGAKISTKLPYIPAFIKKADRVAIGGAIASTLLAASGHKVGRSLTEPGFFRAARQILRSKKLIVPTDVRLVRYDDRGGRARDASIDRIGRNDYILDIGEESIQTFCKAVKDARTILWNGPLGNTDYPKGRESTRRVFAAIKKSRARTVLGGGDLDVVDEGQKPSQRIFVSTGGGAMLEFIARGTLPGVEALKKR